MYKHAKFYPCSKKIPKTQKSQERTVSDLIQFLKNKEIPSYKFSHINSWSKSQKRKWQRYGIVDYKLFYLLKSYGIESESNFK